VLLAEGFRFFFFSNEGTEPPHIHVERGDGYAKFWLEPVDLADAKDLKNQDLKRARLSSTARPSWSDGVSISAPDQPRATDVEVIDGELVVHLEDGRTVHVPLEWFPKLRDASPNEIADWRLVGRGVGIHWPKLDEDLSVRGLLLPQPQIQRRSA
jgi:hypothetical protein